MHWEATLDLVPAVVLNSGIFFSCFAWNSQHLFCFTPLIALLFLIFLPSSYKPTAAPCSPGQLLHSCCGQPGVRGGQRGDGSSLGQRAGGEESAAGGARRSGAGAGRGHHTRSATGTGNQRMKKRWEELE